MKNNKCLIYLSRLLFTTAVVAPALLAAAPRANADELAGAVIQSESCTVDSDVLDTSTGTRKPRSFGHWTTVGHALTWDDGTQKFELKTRQMYAGRVLSPQLSQSETTQNERTDEKHQTVDFKKIIFYADPDYDWNTRKLTAHFHQTIEQKSDSTKLSHDLNPKKSERFPDLLITTTKTSSPVPGSEFTVIKQLGSQPTNDLGFKYLTQDTKCTYSPSTFPQLKFRGFFKNVRNRVFDFAKAHGRVLAAVSNRKKLNCGDSGQVSAECASATAEVNKLRKKREALWQTLFSESRLTSEVAGSSSSGSSDGGSWGGSDSRSDDPYGGSGGGFGGPNICTGGVCNGPHGTTVCTNGVCNGPDGTTVCTGGVCNGPGGTTVCTGSVCNGPNGTTVCTNGICN